MSTPYKEIVCGIRPGSVEELDPELYLAANADVEAAGIDPREHFLRHGLTEGRMQWVASAELSATRDAKLARVKFRRPPSAPRKPGKPANFLSDAAADELRLPDALPLSSYTYGGHVVQMLRDNPDKLFLDVGAGMSPRYYSNVVTAEIHPWPSTDVVCKGEDLPFEDDQFDGVFCLAVLEHTLRPWEVVPEICRVLKPGGRVIVDWPFLQPLHGYPHHYFNATSQGVRSLFEPHCDIVSLTVNPNQHPIFSAYWILRLWRHALPPATAASFEAMRIGDLLGAEAEAQLERAYCQDIDLKMMPVIAAGNTLVAVKRREAEAPLAEADERRRLMAENADLARSLQVMRSSASWRMTAPMRWLHRLL